MTSAPKVALSGKRRSEADGAPGGLLAVGGAAGDQGSPAIIRKQQRSE